MLNIFRVVEASALWGQILYGTSLCSGVEGQLDFRWVTEMRVPAMACRQKQTLIALIYIKF